MECFFIFFHAESQRLTKWRGLHSKHFAPCFSLRFREKKLCNRHVSLSPGKSPGYLSCSVNKKRYMKELL